MLEFHELTNEVTEIGDGDYSAVSNATNHTRKISGLNLKKQMAQNTLKDNIAPEFSTETAYTAGQFVTYQGKIYQFTSDHSVGAWNASHATVSGQNALLNMTAQNALAGNVVEAFDETGVTTYKAGKAIARGGETYVFKVDHSGAWSAADVERSYINDYGVIDDGGIGNTSNLYKVKTRILPFDIMKPLIINVTKPLRASGNYYKVGYQLVTNDALIGRYAVSGDYPVYALILSSDGVRTGTQFTLVDKNLACKGIALEIQEYDSLGNNVANRKEDFVGYSVQLIQPYEPYQIFF